MERNDQAGTTSPEAAAREEDEEMKQVLSLLKGRWKGRHISAYHETKRQEERIKLVQEKERACALAKAAARRQQDDVQEASGLSGRWQTFIGGKIVVRVRTSASLRVYEDDPLETAKQAAGQPYGPQIIDIDETGGVLVEKRQSGVRLDVAWRHMTPQAHIKNAHNLRTFRATLAERQVTQAQTARSIARTREAVKKVMPNQQSWAERHPKEVVHWCHGDLHPENLLADPDTGRVTAILDWEWYRPQNIVFDQLRLWESGAKKTSTGWAHEAGGYVHPHALLAAYAIGYEDKPAPSGNEEIEKLIETYAEKTVTL